MPRPWRRCWLPALPARRLRPAAYSVPAGPRRRARPPLACAVPPTLHRAHTIPPCALAPPRCLLPLCRQPPWGGKTRRAPGPACAHHRTTRTPTTRYTRPRFFDHDALHVPGLDDDVRGLCGTAITSDHQHIRRQGRKYRRRPLRLDLGHHVHWAGFPSKFANSKDLQKTTYAHYIYSS